MSMREMVVTIVALSACVGSASAGTPIEPDLSKYNADSGVIVKPIDGTLDVAWPMAEGEFGHLAINLDPDKPRFASFGVGATIDGPWQDIVNDRTPALFLTVGTRVAPGNRPAEMSVFNTFFDNPYKHDYVEMEADEVLERMRVESLGRRVAFSLGEIRSAWPFHGVWHLFIYPDSRLIQLTAMVTTDNENNAFLYDLGLVSTEIAEHRMAWMDTEGKLKHETLAADAADRAIAVRHRTIVEETPAGSIACFPPPHKFFFPRDYTDNVHTAWAGSGHRKTEKRFGFGIRQDDRGGGNFVPWFNAPPKSRQQLATFFVLTRDDSRKALAEVLRFTHGDRFPDIKDHVTFTSHFHMAIAEAAMKERAEGREPNPARDFVKMFKDMNVNAVHLAEFHGDGHQFDPGPLRLPELDTMFSECERLSDKNLLMIPGEEVDDFLGFHNPGQQHGHWMCLFPKPVYWIMKRSPDQPFVTDDPRRGKVYRVGNTVDMQRLLETEHGLAWTSHPRVKSSVWTPDVFHEEAFYKADTWLGAAWKALPADLSQSQLGKRALDLMDDMANWGDRKYMPGEVDVFKLDHTHELYGHMNINYLQIDHLPKYEEGWQPILDALRAGKFFTTTGEILIDGLNLGGVPSGGTLKLGEDDHPNLEFDLSWTFPLLYLNVIHGNGDKTEGHSSQLHDTSAFGTRHFEGRPTNLKGARWIRIEAWDVAGNGAFSQPIWIEPK